jgi:hypothetical protein
MERFVLYHHVAVTSNQYISIGLYDVTNNSKVKDRISNAITSTVG